jgi:hypothetical protein
LLHPGLKIALVVCELLLQFGLGGVRNGGFFDPCDELGISLLHVVAIFVVTPQHEILLVAAHRQHGDQERLILHLGNARFDFVNRTSQPSLETRLLVEAELPPLFNDGSEMPLIFLQ